MSNSNTTTPENVGQPPDDGGISIHADDSPESVEEVATMVPEYVSTPHSSSECKKVYVESGNDKSMLYVLSIGQAGLDHDDEPLFSLEQEPWSRLPKNALRPPKNSDLAKEVRRRAAIDNNTRPGPRPSNWTRNQMIEWLQENPVSASKDVQFLRFEVLRLREITLQMQRERQQLVTVEGAGVGGYWRGCIPYLRVIMTLTLDDVKSLFLTRGNCLTRAQLDARNSDTRPPNCFERIAELWYSPDFNPIAPPSSCHSDFVSQIDCSHAAVAGLTAATADRIADLFTSMRSKLMTIIKNWEASGQGDGGMDAEEQVVDNNANMDINDHEEGNDDHFGSLAHRPARALDSRAAFLKPGMPSYLLYYWEVAESQQLLTSCLQRLSNRASAADASSAPAVSTRVRRMSSSTTSRSRTRRRRESSTRGETPMSARSSISSTSGGSSSGNHSHAQSTEKKKLIESIQDLVDCQRDLLSDRALDRQHQERENTRKRRFDRHAFLLDEARSYRTKIAELSCADDHRSRHMVQFYNSELSRLEDEIRQVDSSDD